MQGIITAEEIAQLVVEKLTEKGVLVPRLLTLELAATPRVRRPRRIHLRDEASPEEGPALNESIRKNYHRLLFRNCRACAKSR
jgi:hypothetical protein